MPRAPKIWIRTCKQDGVQWYVPDHLRKLRAPNIGDRWMASGEKLSGGFSLLGPAGHGSNVNLGRLEQNYGEAVTLQYCPYCGKPDWKQGQARQMPEPVERQIYRLQLAEHQRRVAEHQHQLAVAEYQRQLAAYQPPPPRVPPPPQQPPPPRPLAW